MRFEQLENLKSAKYIHRKMGVFMYLWLMKNIDDFIADIAKVESPKSATNLYFGDDELTNIRRHNLRAYLQLMQGNKPSVIMVGEAPGYKGCRLTGIAFTSEYILTKSAEYALGDPSTYRFNNPNTNIRQREASATIVWEQLKEYKQLPLLWNIYPFHPHSGSDNTNRTPSKDELNFGLERLKSLISLFPSIDTIVAIGKKSYNTIKKDSFFENYSDKLSDVRHPANGGKKEFSAGLKKLL